MVPRIAYSTRRVATRAIYGSATRKFHGSPISRETMGKKAKELGHKVNMKVGKGLASAIDAGEKATTATKEKLAQGAENTEQNVEEGKDYTAKKADQAMKGAHKAKEDMKKELDK